MCDSKGFQFQNGLIFGEVIYERNHFFPHLDQNYGFIHVLFMTHRF